MKRITNTPTSRDVGHKCDPSTAVVILVCLVHAIATVVEPLLRQRLDTLASYRSGRRLETLKVGDVDPVGVACCWSQGFCTLSRLLNVRVGM